MRTLAAGQPGADPVNRMLCIDLQSYMVDDLLAVADRTSMAASLEVRVPYLDHTLVEFMAGVPGAMKLRGLRKKHFLKRAFRDDLPKEILQRRKSGFSLPVARWLREDLRGLLEETLSVSRLKRDGLFDPAAVAELKRQHDARKRDCSSVLWALLMFHLWADNYAPCWKSSCGSWSPSWSTPTRDIRCSWRPPRRCGRATSGSPPSSPR
jgi:asparagine synthase (glutamine-hydrolysing)